MVGFLVLTGRRRSACFGFIIGIWANSFEQLQFIPMLSDDAAHVPGRRLLFDRHCCRPHGEPVTLFNSGRLPDQRLSAGAFTATRTSVSQPAWPRRWDSSSRALAVVVWIVQDRLSPENLVIAVTPVCGIPVNRVSWLEEFQARSLAGSTPFFPGAPWPRRSGGLSPLWPVGV